MAILIRILVIGFILYWLFSRLKRPRASHQGVSRDAPSRLSPYDVLKISPQADVNQIKKAYHQALQEYHPDKVDHLGEDIKKLAKLKTEEIIKAYQTLKKQKAF